ncbi:hypothetical protein FQA39_LY03315 [Lamprigera yunnana]|nr:hypothetical protein FQA39_LY03315 [Lamprigera yunnana]
MLPIVAIQLILIETVFTFNIDTDFPIVYVNPSASNGGRENFFGYSVILHASPPWIQIGAPRGNSTKIKDMEPGVVYKCDIHGPCSLIDVDRNSGFYASYRDSFIDRKHKAWIGGAMDIDPVADRVAICAHRWANNRVQDYWMLGACYWTHANETSFAKLIPLLDNGKGIIRDEVAKVNVYYFGQGQTGMSAHFSKNKNASELVLGAPGVYNWDGTTLVFKDAPDTIPLASKLQAQSRHKKREVGYTELADLNIANAITTTKIGAFSLFGYSTASGYFFRKDQLLYATGAPRSRNLVGQILMYEFDENSEKALIIKDSRQGYQYGEYFGAALCAGDINEDGYDDLVIGAPFYTSGKYNEGRIFVFMGSQKGSLETPQQNEFIEGKGIGGQFGSSLMFLGDIHRDGYADVAIGAPYEDENSGVLYIHRGTPYGLSSEPSQRIVGKEFVPTIKGFGISISKPTDIDLNNYHDLAIGAYLSGHTVLLRSKPVVTLQQSIVSLTPQLEYTTEQFPIKACFWYTGFYVPATINITRKIQVDEVLLRAYLLSTTNSVQNLTLNYDQMKCENFTILLRENITNRYDPLTVIVSQELNVAKTKREVYYVRKRVGKNQTDNFCKECPIYNHIRSFTNQKLELSFILGCGDDDICRTMLELESWFLDISDNSKYVLGSKDYIKLKVTISNKGEKAFLTQLLVNLPELVYFRSIPVSCQEQNSSQSILCGIDNPLNENKTKSIVFDLDMKEINSVYAGNKLDFQLTVLTSSENSNRNVFIQRLNVAEVADVYLSGKSVEHSYSYSNNTRGLSNFTQTYQIEKFGVSTIDEVSLEIQIPTHFIYKTELTRMVQLYAPEGYHAQQPIFCQSNIRYILENSVNDMDYLYDVDNVDDVTTTTELSTSKKPTENGNSIPLNSHLKRKTRQALSDLPDGTVENSFPFNRTLYINCSNPDIVCASVNCSVGPFKVKQNSAILQLKMILNVSSISRFLGQRDIIVFATQGAVTIKNPINFKQTGDRPDSAKVLSVFIGESGKEKVDTWIIIVAAITGLLLLLLLIIGLIKAGFFQRNKKRELEALKEAQKVEQQFEQDGTQEALNNEKKETDNDDEDFNFEMAKN